MNRRAYIGPLFFAPMLQFFQGVVIGFSVAVPVGPIGLLCIRRSLAEGRVVGFVSGLGAAVADVLYMLVAALGLSAVTNALLEHRNEFQLAGGLFMMVAGLTTFFAKPATAEAKAARGSNLLGAFASTLVLTLMNPSTIVSFLAILAAVGVNVSTGFWSAVLLLAGVFVGSAAWWFILSASATRFGWRVQHGGMRTLNRVSGGLIMGYGAWQWIAALRN